MTVQDRHDKSVLRYRNLEARGSRASRSANLLGEGGFSEVYKGEIYGFPMAIKVFNKSQAMDEPWNDAIFQKEMEMLCLARHHPHINKLLAVSFNGPRRCLLLEYMNGGSLDKRLTNQDLPALQWHERARILLHVLGSARLAS